MMPETTAARFADSLVASAGAVPEYIQPTINVGGTPLHVADNRLSQVLAEGKYPFTLQLDRRSPTPWDAAVKFVETSKASIGFEANAPREWALFAIAKDAAIVVGMEETYGGPKWSVSIAAPDRATAQKWGKAFTNLLPPHPPPPPPPPRPFNVVPVRFWMQDPYSREAYSRRRDITIQQWSEIEENYPAACRADLGKLMSLKQPEGGKLVLLHGQPGSGKTRSILSLISEWRDWCTASVVTDSDRFFGDATYLNSIIFNADGVRDWLLLIIEDGDEFMNVSGRESKGQSIARLLNLADGIVGQGLNLLTLITTNVSMDELNPAIVREGRCMANLHVGAFPASEAAVWLKARGFKGAAPTEDMTLAQMYAALRPKR